MKANQQISKLQDMADVLYTIALSNNSKSPIFGSTLLFLGVEGSNKNNELERKHLIKMITAKMNELYQLLQKSKMGGFHIFVDENSPSYNVVERNFNEEAFVWLLSEIYASIREKSRIKSETAKDLKEYISQLCLCYFQSDTDPDQPLFFDEKKRKQAGSSELLFSALA